MAREAPPLTRNCRNGVETSRGRLSNGRVEKSPTIECRSVKMLMRPYYCHSFDRPSLLRRKRLHICWNFGRVGGTRQRPSRRPAARCMTYIIFRGAQAPFFSKGPCCDTYSWPSAGLQRYERCACSQTRKWDHETGSGRGISSYVLTAD